MTARKAGVVIFRIQLLPQSETFIVKQAEAMRRFVPHFVGWRRVVGGLELPQNTSWAAKDQGAWKTLSELRFRYFGSTRRELTSLKLQSPSLVYAHFALDGFAAMKLAKQLGVPLVTALHGYDMTMTDEALGRTRLGREYLKGMAKLQRDGALFVACSDYVRQRAIQRGYPEERTIVHSIGVDVKEFTPPETPPKSRIVLFVGRLVEKKGCSRLIHAMAEVQQHCADAELVIIGDGPMREECEALAATHQIQCRFLGSQSSSVVRAWMARAKVFCVPSLVASSGDAEGFGIVFIEAQAMGLPVVSTRSGGIPEAVHDLKTGLLVDENDRRGLAQAILKLLLDEELWRQFSFAGRSRVVEKFNLASQTAHLEERFAELLVAQTTVANQNSVSQGWTRVSLDQFSNRITPDS
jgi:colanic acid/amylovoran biosynthesis glycosyltransferase